MRGPGDGNGSASRCCSRMTHSAVGQGSPRLCNGLFWGLACSDPPQPWPSVCGVARIHPVCNSLVGSIHPATRLGEKGGL